jgi:cytochrome c biogenesis protein CcdA
MLPYGMNTLSRSRYYRLAAIVVLLAILLPAPAFAGSGHVPVRVTYVYSPMCSICEHAGPAVRGTVNDAKAAGRDISYEEHSFRSKEGMGDMERFGIDSVPAIIVNDRAIRFEDFGGDVNKLQGLLKRDIEDASQYDRPVAIERKISKDAERDTVHVVTCVSNTGGEPVYATVRGGLCEGVNVVSGDTSWQGRLLPGEKRYITFKADVAAGVKALPPQTLVYSDSLGEHSVIGHETPVYLLSKLSMAAVFLAGLVAGINPCLLAVMAFISAMALSMKGRRIYIIVNLMAFCTGLLAVYLLLGMGFLSLMEKMPSIMAAFKTAIILLLLGLAAFALYEAYQVKNNAERPSLFKSFLNRYKPLYKRYCLVANLGLGGAFGLIKMPCVGGIYIAILGAIVESNEIGSGLPYLAAYNLGVVLPVMALGALLVLGLSPTQVDEFRKRHRYALKLATGVILGVMAAGFIFNLV